MSKTETADVFTEEQMAALGTAIGAAIGASQPKKKMPIGQWDPKTAWQPNRRLAHRLDRECFQNGLPMNDRQMNNKEIDALNRIHRSGRYLERTVEVYIKQEGSEDKLYLIYPNKTIDQRLTMARYFRDLADLATQIADAQDAEDLEEQTRPVAVRRG